MTSIVKARVDEEIKEKAAEILKRSGLTVSDVIRITLNRIVTDDDYFLIPNSLTAETIVNARAGVDVYSAKDTKDLFEQLGI